MESETTLQVIDDLETSTDGQAILAAQKYLTRQQKNKKHFSRVYATICAKVFQLTCDLPYQEVLRLVSMAPPDDVIITLCACIASSSWQGCGMIKEVVKQFCTAEGGLADMLWSECCQQQTQDYSNIFNLPQLLGNKLGVKLEQVFTPRLFLVALMKVVCAVLEKCHHGIRSHDCSLGRLAHFTSKIITNGTDSTDALIHLISFFDNATSRDLLWQRISCSLIGYFSNAAIDVFVEGVLLNTKPSLQSSSATCRILGNSLPTHNRVSYTLCHRCLLVCCYDEPGILYNIAGYLKSSMGDVMEQTLVCLLKVWSDVSLVRHLDYCHFVHLSRAIVLFTSCLSNQLSSELCSGVLHLLMNGMVHHMNNPITNNRLLAMRLAECVSQKLKKDCNPLKFEIEEFKETVLLATMAMPISEQEKSLAQNDISDNVIHTSDHVIHTEKHVMFNSDTVDSDDDLVPYDVTSCDPGCGIPHYLREAMQGIVDNSGSDQLKVIRAIPNLVKSSRHDLDEVCDELTKVLLHLPNQIEENKQATKEAIISLLCNCPIKVSNYLIGQFHSTGYSVEQRLFMLELLSVAGLELSKLTEVGVNMFTSIVSHFYYPLLKYFEQGRQQDELIVAHVIHTLAHMIHCAMPFVDSKHDKMSEHLLEVLLQCKSHSSAFVRQSTLRGLSVVMATHYPAILTAAISQWLQASRDDSDHQCRSLATQIITMYNIIK